MTRSAARTARAAVVALLTGLAADHRRWRPAQAEHRRHPGQLHRLRLRPVPGPHPGRDGRVAEELAVPRGRHLHLRRLPSLPLPAEPDHDLGQHPAPQGWRLLPITLGPQASCSTRFPRYGNDETIDPRPGADGNYGRRPSPGHGRGGQGGRRRPALGIAPRQHAVVRHRGLRPRQHPLPRVGPAFLSAWTVKLHELGYVSGVYSSAGSGIKILDDARVEPAQGLHAARP